MNLRLCSLAAAALVGAAGCAGSTTARGHLPPLVAADSLDLGRYAGTWFEIARFDERYERGCFAATATYAVRSDGQVDVTNACRKGAFDGPPDAAHGRAWRPDPAHPAQLEVQFFWPFRGAYWVLELGPEYSFAVVGHPSRDHLWILARTPQLPEPIYRGILTRLTARGYDVGRLQLTPQPS